MKAEERAVLSLIPGSLEGQKVLDAACGSGRYIRRALERGAAQVVGVDASKEMLERGEQEGVGVVAASFSDERREPQLVVGRLEELPLPDGWADLTICALAVGHTPHLTQALKEMARCIKRGGLIVCSDFHPMRHALGFKRGFSSAGKRYEVEHHWHLYEAWHRACGLAGLTIREVKEAFVDPSEVAPEAITDSRLFELAMGTPAVLVFGLSKTV